MKPVPINGMTLNKELRDKQMTGVGQEGDPMFSVRSNGAQHAVAFNCDARAEELPTPSRDTSINDGLTVGQRAAVAFQPRYYTRSNKTGGQATPIAATLEAGKRNGDSQQCVVANGCLTPELPQRVRIHGTGGTSPTLSSEHGRGHGVPSVLAPQPAQAMAVRRLTPRECERLQGFPDDHTLIPWRGKPAEQCPDGPRYKALGNSMAVPCMAWIGSRIAAQEQEPLRYLSVCSGIEAASVAWEPLGWQPGVFAEVEKFPSAVLAHHWPQVPNLGDMTRYESWDLGAINLLVGGTPCQSFSVAGLRKGLRDPRGGLMLTYLEIARRFGPRWLVWENVPGVLSSHGGRDFGAFLGALGALGYGWAYRVLDAQWFGVAQRRRRVFVIANLGDGAAAAKVLFESESVRRNPAPSREAGERTAATLVRGAKGSGGIGYDNQAIFSQNGDNFVRPSDYTSAIAGSLSARDSKGFDRGDMHQLSKLVPCPETPTVGTLSDGAHNGGGLTARMPTQAAYSPALANPLTARMGKGINTTLDEGQTPIVEGQHDL